MQPTAQFDLDLAERIDHLGFEQCGRLRIVLETTFIRRLAQIAQVLNGLIEPAGKVAIFAETPTEIFGFAKSFSYLSIQWPVSTSWRATAIHLTAGLHILRGV